MNQELNIDHYASFLEAYSIPSESVLQTHFNPDFIQSLSNGVELKLKSFENIDHKRQLLLIGIQNNKNGESLIFGYWISKKYNSSGNELLDILKDFAQEFGLRIKVGTVEGNFIERTLKLNSGVIEDYGSLITVMAHEKVEGAIHLTLDQNLVDGISHISIFYAFCINFSKYIFWLNSYPMLELNILSGWHQSFTERVLDNLQIDGNTKVSIHKQKSNIELEEIPDKLFKPILVPKMYYNQLNYVVNQVNNLRNHERIQFGISFQTDECLFCQSKEISKEHIFPIWLRPFIDKVTFQNIEFSRPKNETLDEMYSKGLITGHKKSSDGFTTKKVCINCNNTWLSELENQVKNLLIEDGRFLDSLSNDISNENAELLARWITIKALLLAAPRITFNSHIYAALQQGIINSGFLVETANALNAKVNYSVSKGFIFPEILKRKKIELDRAKELTANFFKCTIQINKLLFRITFLDAEVPFVRFTSLKRTTKLFPYKAEVIHYAEDDHRWQEYVLKKFEHEFFDLGINLEEVSPNQSPKS